MKGRFFNSHKGFNIFSLLVTLAILVTVIVPLGTLTVTPVKAQTNILKLECSQCDEWHTNS